ncbi:MAG: pyridoxal phosphate-dependent aminotransferase [Lachnospiraceae bacterium]
MALTISSIAKAVKPSSTLAITAKAKDMKAQGLDVVAFVAGEPDFDTPKNVSAVAIDAINTGFTKYTAAAGIVELKEAISQKFASFNKVAYKPEQIVISNGGKHSLTNIFRVLINPGDEVIIPAPYWLSYPEMVKIAGGVPVIVYGSKETDYKVTAAQIKAAVSDKTKALIINTPNNPTGMVYSREELLEIAQVAIEENFYVVSDEMYENLIYGEIEHVSIASLSEEIYERTITCSGLSKSYAMTGWRVGYTGSSLELAKLMASVQSHCTSNVNSIAQKAAVEALSGPQEEIATMKAAFEKRCDYMSERVSKMPYFSFTKPQGAFYLFVDIEALLGKSYNGEKLINAAQIADILIKDYIVAVIPCADFAFPNHIRLSYAIDLEQIGKGLDRIEAFLATLK